MMAAYTELTAARIAREVSSGALKAEKVVRDALERIDRLNPVLNAFVHVEAEAALEKAREVDRKVEAGRAVGPLAGVPVANKANICRKGKLTSCCSRMLADYRPPYDATVIRRIEDAGGVVVGSCNMDEFAMGSSTEFSCFGPTQNPWRLGFSPGGSSGGSAAAVAARMVPVALGSDTGGSIRQPAALCGVVGFKPTYGRVSRFGLVTFASSFDQIGTIARDTADAALLYEVVRGPDPADSTCLPEIPGKTAPPASLEGLTFGLPVQFAAAEGLDGAVLESVRAAADRLASRGARIVEISLPSVEFAVPVYHVLAQSEASSNLARYDGVHYGFRAEDYSNLDELYSRTRTLGFGPETKRRIILGTFALSAGYYEAYYRKAACARTLMAREFAAAFREVDFIIGPTTPAPAFELGSLLDDPVAMYLCDLFTLPVNVAGVTALSVPCGLRDGLPLGLQITAPALEEEALLACASLVEEALSFSETPGMLDL